MNWKIYSMESLAYLTMNVFLRELASYNQHIKLSIKRIGIENPWATYAFESPFLPTWDSDVLGTCLHFRPCPFPELTVNVLKSVLSGEHAGGSFIKKGQLQCLELILSNSSPQILMPERKPFSCVPWEPLPLTALLTSLF